MQNSAASSMFTPRSSQELIGSTAVSVGGFGGNPIVGLSPRLQISIPVTGSPRSPVCAWWDYTQDAWSRVGCQLGERRAGVVVCACSHLTDFGVLATSDDSFPDHMLAACIVVVIASFLFLLASFLLRGTATGPDRVAVNTAVCAFLSHLLLAISIGAVDQAGENGLFAIGILLHFSALCFILSLGSALVYFKFGLADGDDRRACYIWRFTQPGMYVVAIFIVVLHVAFGIEDHEGEHERVYGDFEFEHKLAFVNNKGGNWGAWLAPGFILLLQTLVMLPYILCTAGGRRRQLDIASSSATSSITVISNANQPTNKHSCAHTRKKIREKREDPFFFSLFAFFPASSSSINFPFFCVRVCPCRCRLAGWRVLLGWRWWSSAGSRSSSWCWRPRREAAVLRSSSR